MNGKKPQGFFIYANRLSHISSMLSMAELGRLITALAVYFETGALPASRSRAFNACFEMLREDVDRDVARYREICERNREKISRRWHPKDADTAVFTGIPANTNTTHPNTNQPNVNHPNVNHPNANHPNANQPTAAKARTALTGGAASSPLPASQPSAVPAQHTGNAFPMTKKGGTIHERNERNEQAERTDPRFARCTTI